MLDKLKTTGTVALFLSLFVGFIFSGLLINFFQLCIWITIKPFSPWLFRKINYHLLACLWNQVLIILDWSRSAINIYTDSETWSKLGKENALLILNHSNELDWLVAWALGYQVDILGNSKLFIKKAVEWIPIIGWGWKFAEIGFLERNWEKDQATLDSFVKNLMQYPDPVLLLFFPEGTRFTKEKHEVSMEFANKSGLPHLNNLLIPRTKGFSVITQQLGNKFEAVYSGTLCFNTTLGVFPCLLNVFLGRPVVGDILIERVPFSDIPLETNRSSEWLLQNFQQKDKLMDAYNESGIFPLGSWPAGSGKYFKGPVRCHYKPRSVYPALFYGVWVYLTYPSLFQELKVLFGTGTISLSVCLAILGFTALFVYKLIDITMISRGSSYGRKHASSKKNE